jgi:hypothetical protein
MNKSRNVAWHKHLKLAQKMKEKRKAQAKAAK